jgi:dihydrofolate reductase
MGRLTYFMTMSLDGFMEDATGSFGFAVPDEATHQFTNDYVRNAQTFLFGRRNYETMLYWETFDSDESTVAADFASVWRAADKVVYSSQLESVTSARTRLEREFDPAEVRRLKEQADGDLLVGGATLAGTAIRAGLVDVIGLMVAPVIIGGGKPALPRDVHLDLRLTDSRTFPSGTVWLEYHVGGGSSD